MLGAPLHFFFFLSLRAPPQTAQCCPASGLLWEPEPSPMKKPKCCLDHLKAWPMGSAALSLRSAQPAEKPSAGCHCFQDRGLDALWASEVLGGSSFSLSLLKHPPLPWPPFSSLDATDTQTADLQQCPSSTWVPCLLPPPSPPHPTPAVSF